MNQKFIKYLVIFITAFSLISGVSAGLFPSLFSNFNLVHLLGLSLWGINHFFVWQVFTHTLIYPAYDGVHAGFLIHLALNMFILWKIGSVLLSQKGLKHFLCLFIGGALCSGLTALAVMYSSGTLALFAGASPVIMTLLFALIVLFPEMQLMLFLTIPVRAKWLIVCILGSMLLIDLSNGSFLPFFTNLAAVAFGYVYAISVWQVPGPFPKMRKFDDVIMALPDLLKLRRYNTVDQYASNNSKIYDFKTGARILKDEQFLDACLTKIANEGRSSLTWREKFRLWRVSRKHRKRGNGAHSQKAQYDQFRD